MSAGGGPPRGIARKAKKGGKGRGGAGGALQGPTGGGGVAGECGEGARRVFSYFGPLTFFSSLSTSTLLLSLSYHAPTSLARPLPTNNDVQTLAGAAGANPTSTPGAFFGAKSHTVNGDENFVVESPEERARYKEFGRQFRQREQESLDAARAHATACLDRSNDRIYLPRSTHWRVYLELADLSKRQNRVEDARASYRKACNLQPRASQVSDEDSLTRIPCC